MAVRLGVLPVEPQFRIRWKGYGRDHDTWEPLSNIVDGPILVAKFRENKAATARAIQAAEEASHAAQMVRIRPPMLRFLYELSDEEYVKSSSAAPSSSQASSSSQGAGPSNLQHAFTIRNGAVVSVPAAILPLSSATW